MVHWIRLSAPDAGGPGSVLGVGTKILHAAATEPVCSRACPQREEPKHLQRRPTAVKIIIINFVFIVGKRSNLPPTKNL